MNKKLLLIILIIAISVVVSGCVRFKTGEDTSSVDGGVFKTINKGRVWQQKVLIPTVSGRPKNFSSVSVASMVMDSNDNKAIYFGSVANGLFYTYDGGDNWWIAKNLGQATIRALAVDPSSKCIIYAAIGNELYKSIDCNRTWERAYYDNELTTTVDAIAINHYDSSVLYIGVSRGDLIKSYDRGENWQTLHRFNDKIKKIAIDPNESRTIFVVTSRKGFYRSTDSGNNWTDLSEVLKELKLKMDIKDLIFTESEPNVVFLATYYGLLRSNDSGDTWEKIELIPPEKEATINAIAVNPQDSQEIYYVTNTTFYSSIDGGQNWATIKLPTTRAGWKLLVDPEEPNIIYMGVRSLR